MIALDWLNTQVHSDRRAGGGGQEEDKDKKLTGRAEVGKIIDDVLTKAK